MIALSYSCLSNQTRPRLLYAQVNLGASPIALS